MGDRMRSRTTALAALAVLIAAAGARANEEYPVECDEGNEPLLIEYGQHTVDCELHIPTDFDRFRFFGEAGDVVRIVVRGNTNNLDPRIELFEPGGNVIADEFCGTGCCDACTVEVELVLGLSGIHTILLSDAGTDNAGAYTLQLERILPTDLPPTISYDSTVADALAPSTDTDFWTFEAEAGTRFRIIVRGTTNNLDPRMRLLNEAGENVLDDPDGARCSSGCCDTCSFTLEQTIPATGRYFFMIDEWGADNTGGYEISLQCLVGNCCPVAANLNGDCCLDVLDFFLFLDLFGAGDDRADFTGDGTIDVRDFFAFLDAFAIGCQ